MTISLEDKTVILTGATEGIGKATAFLLAKDKPNLLLVTRNKKKTEKTIENIKKKTKITNLDYFLVDFSSLDQVKNFTDRFKEKYDHLDILINNAGMVSVRRKTTKDGLELTFTVNYLAPFLLTNLLLDKIKKSVPARIINVASAAHYGQKIDFNDIQMEKKYNVWTAYSRSKLGNIMFTYSLANKLIGSGVTVNCLHPGTVRSSLPRVPIVKWLWKYNPFFISTKKSARYIYFLVTSEELNEVTGKYFDKKIIRKSSRYSCLIEEQEHLWELS
ncbi:MAG: SDR family oxidoreductase, partial [Candidatus Thorarchaeota archaeon]